MVTTSSNAEEPLTPLDDTTWAAHLGKHGEEGEEAPSPSSELVFLHGLNSEKARDLHLNGNLVGRGARISSVARRGH